MIFMKKSLIAENATEFDFIEPSTSWKFKDIKCK